MYAFTVRVHNFFKKKKFILAFCHVDIDVCICSFLLFFVVFCCFLLFFCCFLLFFDCQVDFDVDRVQRCDLENLYGVQRYIRVIIINYR